MMELLKESKMKIAIVTITDGQNYGNRLQNFALQQVLKNMGYEVQTLKRKTYRDLSVAGEMLYYIKIIVKRLMGRKYAASRLMRKNEFDRFNREYIQFSDMCLHDNVHPEGVSDQFDYFIVGSDQVWNAGFRIISDDISNYLLSFARSEQRIAYAASFGTDTLAEGTEALFKKELSKFKEISVREHSGADIVRSFGINAEVVLDPVLLLSKEEWLSIAKKPKFVGDSQFIVTYFLSDRDELIDRYSKKLPDNTSIFNLKLEFCSESKIKSIEEFVTAPDEFIWLIANAKFVLTDSFHATAFSILFHRPFWVFERKAINNSYKIGGRINTILNTFNLMDHKRMIDDPVVFPSEVNNDIDEIMENEKQKSFKFLKRALSKK